MENVRDMQRFMERRERDSDLKVSCFQLLIEDRKRVLSAVELFKLQETDESLEKTTWGGQKKGEELPMPKIELSECLHRRRRRGSYATSGKVTTPFWNPTNVVQETEERLNKSPKRILGDQYDSWKATGKPTDGKIMNFLNMLSSGNNADRNEDVAYMADKTRRE